MVAEDGLLYYVSRSSSKIIDGESGMSAIMDQLKADHGNISRLLAKLDEQMRAVHDEENADFDLMHDIMLYMTHYPDHTHHPLEDLVFRKLMSHDSSAESVVTRLEREHIGLAEKGQRFSEMLRHVVDGAMVERNVLEETGRDYVAFLRSHMEIEDSDAFPRAEQVLSAEDWKDVASSFEARTDPVFGPIVADEFRSLFEYIQRES
ncbi:MAG: hemerythrin domain-containing protein [Gammaproteobacteria bacterium]|nr:hemerythrin domain-containing protein [Gammaproteobacteria bacterium]